MDPPAQPKRKEKTKEVNEDRQRTVEYHHISLPAWTCLCFLDAILKIGDEGLDNWNGESLLP